MQTGRPHPMKPFLKLNDELIALPCPSLDLIRCQRCESCGITVISTSGEAESYWCSIDCARLDGWPWLLTSIEGRKRDTTHGHQGTAAARIVPG
jgi:hypothetical protein